MSDFGTPTDNDMDFDLEVDAEQLREIESGETFKDYSVPEGKYLARIVSIESAVSGAQNKMKVWTFSGIDPAIQNKTFKFYTVLKSSNMTLFLKALKFKEGMKAKDLIGHTAKIHLIKDKPYTKADGSVTLNSKIKSVLPAE